MYIAFKKDKRNFAYLHLQKSNIKIWLNAKRGDISDPKEIAENVAAKGHFGYGEYEINMSDDNQLEYILSLIKDAIKLK